MFTCTRMACGFMLKFDLTCFPKFDVRKVYPRGQFLLAVGCWNLARIQKQKTKNPSKRQFTSAVIVGSSGRTSASRSWGQRFESEPENHRALLFGRHYEFPQCGIIKGNVFLKAIFEVDNFLKLWCYVEGSENHVGSLRDDDGAGGVPLSTGDQETCTW
jgi:hypothetical protein